MRPPGVRCRGPVGRLKAGCLWAGRGYAISHGAAAALWGFDRFEEGRLELSLLRCARPHGDWTVHRVEVLSHRDVTAIDGLCVTSATRTLVDLAAHESAETLRASLDHALRRKWTTLDRLEAALSHLSVHAGRGPLRELVREYLGGNGPGESELEARVQELLEQCGFPRAERQRSVVVSGRVRRLDFRIPGTPVVIEADGYAWHSSPRDFEKDRARNNALIARGFRVLHWTWAALRDEPEELIRQLCETLLRAGGRSVP
ncbi:MAG: hypothetical protein AMXMBFR34_08680 [Myxococcaceae bacterium]